MTTIFPKSLKSQPKSKLLPTTIRDLGGGLNSVDDELSMNPRFQVILKNFHRTSSGSQRLRFGNVWFADLANIRDVELREDSGTELREDGGIELRESYNLAVADAQILDMEYFNGSIIAVTTNGYVAAVDGLGSITMIWTPEIAAALPGAPGFWSNGLEIVDFVPFKNTLIIHNGVDKPITIDGDFTVTYLQDLGSGSNVNVPIGKYGCVAANYHCVSGIEGSPTEVVISSKGTAGTFPLDPDPNDAISVDVGAYAPEGASEILGIAGYKSYLIVFLQGISLQVKLGVYDDSGAHTPEFPDDFPTFGLIGSRCISKVETDLMFAGIRGMTNARRSITVGGQIDSALLSGRIEPLYQGKVGNLSDEDRRLRTFTVYDPLSHNLVLYFPDGETITYTTNEKLGYKAWTIFDGPIWTCGCTSLLGRVFLAKGSKIYQVGNDTFGERYFADMVNDRDKIWSYNTVFTAGDKVWDRVTEQSFTCNVTHTSRSTGTMAVDIDANPSFWTLYKGEAIDFEFETPWFDGKDPMKVKKLRFISIASKGTAEFTLKAFVDNLYKDFEGNIIYDEAAAIEMVGNDALGFGLAVDSDLFGTGRRSRDPRLFEFLVKFKTIKFNISGSVRKPLELMNMSYLFARGSYQR